MTRVTDEMVERALAEKVGLIQGFSYADRHCIRDFRKHARGVEVWSVPRSDLDPSVHAAFQKRLEFEKLRAQLFAALGARV